MEVGEYLEHLNLIDRREAAFAEQMAELSMAEFRALATLAEAPMIIKEVAGHRAVAAQGAGKIIERLRQRGFLEVERYARDKRAKVARITEQGRVALARGNGVLSRVLADASLAHDGGFNRPNRVAQGA